MAYDGGQTGAAQRLRSFVERVERLETEIAELNSDKKEVYAEAKGEGYDVKTLKKVIQRRRMDRADRQEADALLDLYESTLNGGPLEEPDPLDN